MRIYSIFVSIDGEVNYFGQGRFTTFIRTAGCNLRCKWCDTQYALNPLSGIEMSVKQIIDKIKELGVSKVTLTGGEPLYQISQIEQLLESLYREGFLVSIETNGSIQLPEILSTPAFSVVMDYKLNSSGMTNKMVIDYFRPLKRKDFVKFVIADRNDYLQAKQVRQKLIKIGCRAKFAFSPMYGDFKLNQDLLIWLKEDSLFNIFINYQLHKCMGLREDS